MSVEHYKLLLYDYEGRPIATTAKLCYRKSIDFIISLVRFINNELLHILIGQIHTARQDAVDKWRRPRAHCESWRLRFVLSQSCLMQWQQVSAKRKKELVTDRCKDLEAKSRHCNVPITGVKQSREHGKRRALCSKPTQDNFLSQASLPKCHYFSKKESLLKKAMKTKTVTTTDGDHI